MADVNANIGVGIDTSDALNQLKNLQRQISQFNQAVAKSSEQATIAQRDLQKNLLNNINAIQGFSAELRTVKTTAESFTSSLEKNKFSIKEYFRYAAGATNTFGKSFKSEFDTIEKTAIERVKSLQTQYIKMGRDANGAMQAIAVRPTILDMNDLTTKTMIAGQKQALFNQLIDQGSTKLLNFGKNTQWAGRQLMVGFTLPLVSFGVAASKAFMQMEQASLKFRKVYGDLSTTKEQAGQALVAIQELAKGYTKYGIAVADTIDLAASAAAAGFKGVDLQNQTAAATKLAVLGQIDQQKALETTIALQNAFKMSSGDLATNIDFLNAVENQTVTSLDDITTAIPKVAPVIVQLGGDVKDLAFFLTAMKEGGINASEGANAIKSGLGALINPTKKASDMLMGFGINVRDIVNKNQGDLRGTVVQFAQALDQLAPLDRARAIEQMFGKFQFARLSTLFQNVTKDGTQAARVLDLAGSSVSQLSNLSEKELGQTAASSMNKFKKAVEDIKVSLVPLGQMFLEIATPFIDFGSKMLDAFNQMPDGIKKAIGTAVAVIGGLGPILLMTFGLVNNGIANMIKFFATVRMGYLKITGQAKGIGVETQYMTTEQLNAAAAAASLEQAHSRLEQKFTAEKSAVDALRVAYMEAAAAGERFAVINPGMMRPGYAPRKMATGGMVSGPGTGTSDSVPAMLSNGEAVIPADKAKKYAPLIAGIISGKIPGFAKGTVNVGGQDFNVESRQQSTRDAIQKLIDGSLGQIDDAIKTALQALAADTKVTLGKFKEQVREASGGAAGPAFAASDYEGRTKSFNAKGAGERRTVTQQLISERGSQAAEAELQRANAAAQATAKRLEELGATTKQITAAIQIDRAHVIEVTNEQKKLVEAWHSDVWTAQTGAENNLSNSLKASERNREVYLGYLKQTGATEQQINTITDKVTRGVALNEEELSIQGQALARLATDAQNDATLQKKVSANFLMYADAVSAGQLAKEAVIATQGPELQAAITRTKETVQIGVERILNAAVVGAQETLQVASPSKKMHEVGQQGAQGLINGAESKIDEMTTVGKELADAAAAGVRQSTRVQAGVQSVGTGPVSFTKDPKSGNVVNAERLAQLEANREIAKNRLLAMQSRGVESFSSAIMKASFALSSISGITAMFGGKIGEISGIIFTVSSALGALASITRVLADVEKRKAAIDAITNIPGVGKIAGMIGSRATAVKGAMGVAEGASLFSKGAGVAGLLSNVGKGLSFFLRFLGPVGIGLSVLSIALPFVIKAVQDEQAKLTAFGDIVDITAGQIQKLGDAAGEKVITSTGLDTAAYTSSTTGGVSTAKSSATAKNEDFLKTNKKQIDALKVIPKEDAQKALDQMSYTMLSSGLSQKTVNEFIASLLKASERKDIKFKFGNVSIDKTGTDKVISDIQKDINKSKVYVAPRSRAAQFGDTAGLDKKIVDQGKQLGKVNEGLGLQLEGNKTKAGLEEYKRGFDKVKSAILSASAEKQKFLMSGFRSSIDDKNLRSKVAGLKDYTAQLKVVEAVTAGVDSKTVSEYVDALGKISNPNSTAGVVARAKAEQKLTTAIEQSIAPKLTAAEITANQNAANEALTISLTDQIANLQNQSALFSDLTKNGIPAAEAIKLLGNESLLAAEKSGKLDKANLELVKQLIAAQTAADKRSSTFSGAKKTTPYEDAIDQLKAQRAEVSNSVTAYARLRKAKVDVNTAYDASQDATLAKALATVKYGSKEWNNLAKQIKAAAKAQQDFAVTKAVMENAKNNSLLQAFTGITPMLSKLGLSLDDINNILGDPNLAKAFIADLKDGAVNSKAIRDYINGIATKKKIQIEFDMSTPEGITAAFDQAYGRQMEAFDNRKTAVEQEFAGQISAAQSAVDSAQKKVDSIQNKIDKIQDGIDAKQREVTVNFERPIQALQDQSTVLSNDLAIMDHQAESINKQYDNQAAALGEVKRINDQIIAQQKSQLSIADALSSGDISAAAAAMQQSRAENAAAAQATQGDLLNSARQAQIDGLKSASGMSRTQIEEKQYQISQQVYNLEQSKKVALTAIQALEDDIYAIQVKELKPAQDSLKAAQDTLTTINEQKTAKLAAIDAEKLEWDKLKLKVDEAKVGATGYLTTLTDVKNMVDKIAGAWANVTSAKAKADSGGSQTTSDPYGGMGKTGYDALVTQAKEDLKATNGSGVVPGSVARLLRMSTGGMVPSYFAEGGYARGTDTIPAMLTPGEYVVNQSAASRWKPMLDAMNYGSSVHKPFTTPRYSISDTSPTSAIDTGTINSYKRQAPAQVDNSVYNYNLSVNVEGSNASANDIATVVMTQLRNSKAQQVKGQVIR